MKLLHQYVLKNVLSATALVVLVILGIQMFVSFLHEIDDIRQNYGAFQVITYITATLPGEIYPLFPAAALLGCLIGLGRLASQSELVVMLASGLSKAQITFSAMRAVIWMLLVMIVIGEVINPKLQAFAEHYKISAQTGHGIPENKSGFWIRNDNHFFYIEKINPNNKQLFSILQYQFDKKKLITASFAKEGRYQNGKWIFYDINESQFSPTHVKLAHYDKQSWLINLEPNFIDIANLNPEHASLPQLKRYIRYLSKTGLYTDSYEFEFWERLLRPLTALIMVGLAVPFIFGPLRSKTMGFRILIGVMVGFGFYTFNQFIGPFSLLYQIPPFLSAAIPLMLFGVLNIAVLLWI